MNLSHTIVMAVLVTAIHAVQLQTTFEVGDGGRAWMAVTSTAMTVSGISQKTL